MKYIKIFEDFEASKQMEGYASIYLESAEKLSGVKLSLEEWLTGQHPLNMDYKNSFYSKTSQMGDFKIETNYYKEQTGSDYKSNSIDVYIDGRGEMFNYVKSEINNLIDAWKNKTSFDVEVRVKRGLPPVVK